MPISTLLPLNGRSSRRGRVLRGLSLLTSATFAWTSLLAAPAQLLAQGTRPRFAAPRPIPAPVAHDDPAWHTIDYYKVEPSVGQSHRALQRSVASVSSISLLDEVGRMQQPFAPDAMHDWKRSLHQPRKLSSSQAAKLHIWVGEATLAQDEQPEQALWHFAQAKKLTKPPSVLHGLAVYDTAVALFYEGAYNQAASAFKHILAAKPALHGFDRRTAVLFWRHARACAGYHAERAALGIPEPPKLDPLCGASALALALKAHHKPYDKKTILANMHVTGRGSSMQDVLDGAQKLGLSAQVVHATDKGLQALPKPLVAYVEHDHFVSVSKADEKGVSYLCSDCGPWPGGQVNLTWAQWHKMEATAYAVLSEPGSDIDGALHAMAPQSGSAKGVQIASAGQKLTGGVIGQLRWMNRLRKQIIWSTGGEIFSCGFGPGSQQCPSQVDCPEDPCPVCNYGPSAGDPVNLATGEEEYTPEADISVYNPLGPSVVWSRRYDSLRGNTGTKGYQSNDFGQGWSHAYNIGVLVTYSNNNQTATCYFIEPNGARIQLSAPQIPSASVPHVTCSVPAGVPMLAEWDYDSTINKTYFVLTHPDRTKWILPVSNSNIFTGAFNTPAEADTRRALCLVPQQPIDTTPPTPRQAAPQWFPLGQEVDRNGNGITFNYGTTGSSGYPLLTSIVDKNNSALLTFSRDGNGHLTSITDRYGRSVYYHGAQHDNPGSSLWELDHVSQLVPTGAASPPDRYVYGYQNIDNGDMGLQGGGELVAMLHTITVPSPTGTGTATATINYLPSYCTVSSIVDANGNTRSYNQPDQSHTQVIVKNAQNNVAYRYTVGYDMNMSGTTVTNGATDANGNNTQIVRSPTFADANNPYRPSQMQDGNGYANGGANGKGTWTYTWDQYGNCLTETSPRGVTTTNTYTYAQFALGELTSFHEGAKSPTSYTYYEPSGLTQSVTQSMPGTSGSNLFVTTSYTYDALGNMLTVTEPGNNAVNTIVTSYNYTSDGTYAQNAAIGQPITETDNLGHTTHHRYDVQGNEILETDAVGIQTQYTYNIANQRTAIIMPSTGQTGTGQGQNVATYLYNGGPATVTTVYDESGQSVRTQAYAYGYEGEVLAKNGNALSTSTTYDALYRIKTIGDGSGHITNYTYGANGYLASMTYPASNGTSDKTLFTSYDANGNCLTRIDGRGIVTNYVFNDVESLLTDIQYPGSPAINVNYSYDSYGRRASLSDAEGTAAFNYDDGNRTTGTQRTYTNLPQKTITYSYFPNGSLQILSTPAGAFSYTYDGGNRLTGLSNPFSETCAWSYLDNDWLWQQSTTASLMTHTFNAKGQPTTLENANQASNHATLSRFNNMTYDAVGNRTGSSATVTSAPAYSGLTAFSYDSKNQLLQEQSSRVGGYTNTFGYDASGNPTTFRGGAKSYNVDNQNTAFTYDGSGNPTSYGGIVCSFDAENRLTSYGTAFTAGYNEDGLRAWKQTSTGRTYYLYNGVNPICELDSNGNVVAVNTFGPEGLISRRVAGNSIFYTFDSQGNVSQRLSATGGVLDTHLFDAFGADANASNIADPFCGFGAQAGYITDKETGLQLLGHRYYDPRTGRFVTRDPTGYQGGINLYAYVQNNPVTRTDPSGFGPPQAGSQPGPTGGYCENKNFRNRLNQAVKRICNGLNRIGKNGIVKLHCKVNRGSKIDDKIAQCLLNWCKNGEIGCSNGPCGVDRNNGSTHCATSGIIICDEAFTKPDCGDLIASILHEMLGECGIPHGTPDNPQVNADGDADQCEHLAWCLKKAL